jgi:hypothetical protein
MFKEVRLEKTVYNSETADKVVNNEFTQFVDPVVEEDTDSVAELFRLYDKFYFSIPLNGDSNSHEFLIKKSSEIVDTDQTTEDIQPLLEEITQLREQLLIANEQVLELQNEIATNE